MRQKIYYDSDDYSGSAIIWFILLCFVFCCFFWWTPTGNYSGWNWGWSCWGWLILGILFVWWIFALCFTPLDVTADDDEVRIRRPFKTRKIKMSEIQSAEPYQVSKNASKKAAAPVKTFGKWGRYHDDKIGDYFAYYGKPDNTVLITLNDGRKYIVGGTDAKAMADYINSKTKNS